MFKRLKQRIQDGVENSPMGAQLQQKVRNGRYLIETVLLPRYREVDIVSTVLSVECSSANEE